MRVAREWTIVWLIPTIPIPEQAQKNAPLYFWEKGRLCIYKMLLRAAFQTWNIHPKFFFSFLSETSHFELI